MADYYRDVIRLRREAGFELKRQGRGDHGIWWNPRNALLEWRAPTEAFAAGK